MKILYLTNNPNLRSTTCVLDAIFKYRKVYNIEPVIAFPEEGEWSKALSNQGIECFIRQQGYPTKSRPFAFLKDFLFWVSLIKKERIELIHVNEHDVYPVIMYAARFLKKKVIVGVRFVLTESFSSWAFREGYVPQKLLFTSQDQVSKSKQALPFELSNDDVIVFGNGRDFDELISGRSTTISLREKFKVPDETWVLGTASAIEPRKRLEDFIQVINQVKKEGHSVKGFIAGGGRYQVESYYEKLKMLVIELNLTEDIVFLGDFNDMNPFYSSIDIFLSTSELETFGMSVCEAMSFGKPVVAFEGGSVKEVLDDDNYVVENYDCRAMTLRVSILLSSKDARERAAFRNKQRVFDCFNAPILARNANNIYKQLLES